MRHAPQAREHLTHDALTCICSYTYVRRTPSISHTLKRTGNSSTPNDRQQAILKAATLGRLLSSDLLSCC